MMHRILFLLLIYFNLLHSNFSQDIIPEKQTYVGIYGKSLTLKWKLELDNDDKLIAVNLHYVPENGVRKKLFGSTGYSEPKAEPYTETTFGSRMKASISKEESKYEVTIDNLRYNDSGSFSLEVYIQLSGEKGVQQFEKVIKISEVKGGPQICGDDIPKSFEYKEGDSPTINITLCGVPKPKATFNFSSNGKQEISPQAMSNNYTYLYSCQLPKLSQAMCNKTFSFEAFGYNNSGISQTSIITLDAFKPTAPNNVIFSRVGNCTNVKWDRIDTGNCKVDYSAEFFSGSLSVGIEKNDSNNTLDTCSLKYINATFVSVFASYKGQSGKKSERSPLRTTLPPTTTVTTTPKTTLKGDGSFSADDDDENSSTPMIIGVVCGIFLLLLLVVVVVFLMKRKKKNGKDGGKLSNASEDIELKRPPSYQDEGDYASVGGIYAELGKGGRIGPKPEPIESNYSEVKIDESGYPAVGPTSDMSKERPSYSTTVNRDRSRRHSLSADIEDNSEVIV